ncbi:hypothetical protein KF913_09365 [Candidatus Obscuribacterales bacterium]|nr:hypothetical protein [Candidatus Obscuribacterales bacterium]
MKKKKEITRSKAKEKVKQTAIYFYALMVHLDKASDGMVSGLNSKPNHSFQHLKSSV